MKKEKVIFQLAIDKRLTLELGESESKKDKVSELLNKMTDKEIKQFLLSQCRSVSTYGSTKWDIVKEAIDRFDPICVMPDEPGEYDNISARIADRVEPNMTLMELAVIVAEEFNFSFEMGYTTKFCMSPAKRIHFYLN